MFRMFTNTPAMLDSTSATTFTSIKERVVSAVKTFDSEEDGLSTVDKILLLFIGVVIIIALLSFFWDTIWPRVQETVNNLFDTADQGQNP